MEEIAMAQFFECCKGCDEETGRHPGCHAKCSEYLHAKEEYDRCKAARDARRAVDYYGAIQVMKNQDQNAKRKKHYRKNYDFND